MIKSAYSACLLVVSTMAFCTGAVLQDSSFAFRTQVESVWGLEKIDTLTQCIYSLNSATETKIYIERIEVDTISVISGDECAQMYFLSNYSVARQKGLVQYFDSSTAIRQGSMRAYELYAFYNDKENGANTWWAELSRWCSKGKYVFQLTVLGDTTDLFKNYQKYKDMLDKIDIWFPEMPTKTISAKFFMVKEQSAASTGNVFDLFGRRIGSGTGQYKTRASGCRVAPMKLLIEMR